MEGETDVTADLREVCGNGSSRITQAMRPDGSTTDDQAEIAAILRSYFKSLFQEVAPEDGYSLSQPVADLCRNLHRLGEGAYETLCGEASIEEVRYAVANMSPNSAPGLDGITAGFYQAFLDLLGEPLVALVNEVLK
ncbi:hypothetical protein HPB51_011251 [Rhipicephalus microplus]|uniref:Uncharacterized protein n=1 Tax=Rhipicephalus microplus TaxID=6941 RepID=A0A9J6DMD6_RHIMP|nr:hypothetical protein HPB51_011251 [Rhipicephalus microplus]